jgi:hypothetical protein
LASAPERLAPGDQASHRLHGDDRWHRSKEYKEQKTKDEGRKVQFPVAKWLADGETKIRKNGIEGWKLGSPKTSPCPACVDVDTVTMNEVCETIF